MQSIPTEADWGDWQNGGLDVAYAHKIFAGKPNEEVQEDFARAIIERTDELRLMPKVPFQYYIFGFRDYVMAGNFGPTDSADAASCFLDLIEEKLQNQPDYIVSVMRGLMPAILYVSSNQAVYDADIDIYGDFQEQGRRIADLYLQLETR